MTLAFVLFVELVLLAWAWRRSGFMLYPHGFLVYVIGAQVFLWLNATGLLYYEFLESYTSGAYIQYFDKIVLLFFAVYLGAAACAPRERVNLRNIVGGIRITTQTEIAILFLIVAMYARQAVYFTYLDWGSTWSNTVYLTMGTPTETMDQLGSLLMVSRRAFGVLAVILATFLACHRRWGPFVFVLPLAAWNILFEMAAHSRTAVLLFLTVGLTVLMLRPHRKLVAGAMFAAAMVALMGSLSGRGSEFHGFASLPYYLTNIVNNRMALGDLTNIFEGAFVTAEYFAQSIEYAPQYRTLSLSPLFSFIDGFEAIRQDYEVRLTRYVPNSAVTEVLSFGGGYAALFFGVQFLGGWLSAKVLARDRSLLAMGLNALMLLAAYLQFTYSARTVFRFYVAAAVVSGVLWLVSAAKRPVAPLPVFEKPSGRRKALAECVPVPEPAMGPRERRRKLAGVS